MAKAKMCRLSESQLKTKLDFIDSYIGASNAATGSTFDANSNVSNKNVATMLAELNKDINIQVKRGLVTRKIKELYGDEIAETYIKQLEDHLIYAHDETSAFLPYCVAISMYPFLTDGLKAFGGESKAPRHLSSFNGGFINLIFAISSQFAGAVATVEYFLCFDHFARKDYGDDYLDTHEHEVTQELQQTVYALNQPASARGFQSVFWNVSIFDKFYFDSLFGNFYFPDGDKPKWESVDRLQKFFMKWFNKERTKALLTFPVVTVALLHDGQSILDKDYREFTAQELSEGNSFFIYTSDTVDSLSSCCRLRNYIGDQLEEIKNDFSYSLGAGGVQTGSMNVISLNLNRFTQDVYSRVNPVLDVREDLVPELKKQIFLMHKYQLAYRSLFKDLQAGGMLPVYDAGYISLDKQFLTIGINGLVEAAEACGIEPSNNQEYKSFCAAILEAISDCNKETCRKHAGVKINTEMVPGESLGVKFAQWDKKDGYYVPRDCYNSYFFPSESKDITILDKMILHGKEIVDYLDGGSACHLQLEEYPDKETYAKLLDIAAQVGCSYWTTNVKITICNQCGHIDKHTLKYCPSCGSADLDYATRIIGYLRRISNFSKDRQIEESKRYYHGHDG